MRIVSGTLGLEAGIRDGLPQRCRFGGGSVIILDLL